MSSRTSAAQHIESAKVGGIAKTAGMERSLYAVDELPKNIPGGIIRGLGRATQFVETTFGKEPYQYRTRTTEFMVIDEHPLLVRESEPHSEAVVDPDRIPTIWHSLGWTEFPDTGTGQMLHDELAEAFPGCYVTTAETLGVNKSGFPLSIKKALEVSPEKIVDAHWQIARSIAGRAPLVLVGESAGGGNVIRLAKRNLDTQPEEKLKITEIHIVSGCVVASNVDEIDRFRRYGDKTHCVKTLPQFFGHMGVDIPRTAIKKPKEAAQCMLSLGAAVLRRPLHMARTAPAILGNLINLLPGTDWKTINEVFSQHQVYIYVGSRDALREDKMYQKLMELYPDNVHVKVVPGEGHAMALGAVSVAQNLKIKVA